MASSSVRNFTNLCRTVLAKRGLTTTNGTSQVHQLKLKEKPSPDSFKIPPEGVTISSPARQAHQLTPKDKPYMDLLPIPEGSWQEYHDKRNAKYNIHLLGGALFFGLAYGVAYSQGFLFVNPLPPLPSE